MHSERQKRSSIIVENFSIGKCFTRSREKSGPKKKKILSVKSRFKKFNTGHESTHAIDVAKRPTRAIKIKEKRKRKFSRKPYTALTKSRCNISRGLLR